MNLDGGDGEGGDGGGGGNGEGGGGGDGGGGVIGTPAGPGSRGGWANCGEGEKQLRVVIASRNVLFCPPNLQPRPCST